MNKIKQLIAAALIFGLGMTGTILPTQASVLTCNNSGPDYHGRTLPSTNNADYSNANLAGSFNNGWAWNVSFFCANLNGARIYTQGNNSFQYANLTNAWIGAPFDGNPVTNDFRNAVLSNTTISSYGNFSNLDLQTTTLPIGIGGILDYANLSGKTFNRVPGLPNVKCSSCLNTNFTGATFNGNLEGDFTNANLTNAVFNGDISNINFTNANLTNAVFNGDVSSDNFTNSNLTNVKFKKISHLNFNNSNLTGVDLSGVVCSKGVDSSPRVKLCGIQSSNLTATNLILPQNYELQDGMIVGPGVSFNGKNLSGVNLKNIDLTHVQGIAISGMPALPSNWKIINDNLVGPGADIRGADFGFSDLSKVSLLGTRTTGVYNIGALPPSYRATTPFPGEWNAKDVIILGPGVDLTDANLYSYSSDFSNLNLSGANLTRARIASYSTNLDFSGSNFTNVNLTSAIIGDVGDGSKVDFSGVNFTNATFYNTSFQDSVDFTNSNLKKVNLSKVRMCVDSIDACTNGPFIAPVLKHFKDAELAGANLSGFDLTQLDGGSAEIDLTSSTLTNTVMSNTDFSKSSLAGADLTGADLTGADLTGADLTGADLTGTKMNGTNLLDAKLTRIQSRNISGSPDNLDANFSVFKGFLVGPTANLSHADLSDAALSNLNLAGARLNYADLSGSDLTNTNLSSANLNFANLISANLQSANLAQAHMDYADLDSANLSGANLTSAIMFGTNLSNAMFARTTVPSAFKGQGSGLRKGPLMAKKPMRTIPAANLTNANISNSDIRKANFSGANLVGATFYKSNTSLAKFTGSIWGNTVCADGSTSNQRKGATCLGALLLTTKFPQTKVLLPASLKKSSVVNLPAVTMQNQPVILRSSGGCTVTGVYSSINGKRILSYYKLTAKKTTGSCTVTASATANTFYTNLLQSQVVTITN